MVVFDKQKYACLSCIRGHRSSSCEHRDRILLQVRKPGRKSLSEPRSRFALVRKENSPVAGYNHCNKSSKASDYKLVRVPNIPSSGDAEKPRVEPKQAENGNSNAALDRDDDDVVLTEKFVFVHVGDNLYRRELRPDLLPSRSSPMMGSQSDSPSPEFVNDMRNHSAPHFPHMPHTYPAPEMTSPASQAMTARMNAPMHLPMNSTINSQRGGPMRPIRNSVVANGAPMSPHMNLQLPSPSMNTPLEAHANNYSSIKSNNGGSQMNTVHNTASAANATPPLVIAPMSVHSHARNSNNGDILQELGLTTEEAEQLWPGAFDAGTDLSYASQCVMPGQCQCGDSCACPDCYEHKLKFESMHG